MTWRAPGRQERRGGGTEATRFSPGPAQARPETQRDAAGAPAPTASLPLASFLGSLGFCGIRPSPRDYLRIQTLLRSRCRWTLPAFRDALAALVASDRDQQRAFVRHFDGTFAVPAADGPLPAPAAIDVPRALAELRALLDRPAPTPTPARSAQPPGPRDDRPPLRPKPPPRRLAALSALLLAVLVAAVLYHWPEPVPRLCLDHPELVLNPQAAGAEGRHPLTVENCGSAPLTLGDHAWQDPDPPDATGATAPVFRLAPAPAGRVLNPGERLTLGLWFRPSAPADYRARLRLQHNGTGPPAELAIRGQGLAPVASPQLPRNRVYRDVPTIRELRFTPAVGGALWQRPALYAALAGLALALLLVRRWRRGRVPQDAPAAADPDQPGRFRFGTVGGPPPARLDHAAAAAIAEALGHYRSDLPSRRLDTDASIRATLAGPGLSALRFRHRQLVQGLLILEDEDTRARAWNPIAAELARVMPTLGIPVRHGRWRGSPLTFRDAEGRPRVLEDLEGEAPALILLLFTDGRHLDQARRRPLLEALAHWPAVAWLDPREPRSREGAHPPAGQDADPFPGRLEVPVYPATPAGILDAVRLYRGERRADPQPATPPPRPGLPLPAALERHLGDALDWAQDCALLHPTIPVGLAQALRRRFYPALPPEAIERLYTLPDTAATAAGLRLSDPVRKALRELAAARRGPADRQGVQAFILTRIEAARPGEDAPELMQLGWELAREKVRFESDPANDCRRLAELERHPALGTAVHDWLRDFRAPGVPFVALPTRPDAAVRLARFRDNPLGLARDRLYWLAWPQRVLAGVLLLCCAGLAGLSVYQALTPPDSSAEWRWADDTAPADALVWTEHGQGDTWTPDSPAIPPAALTGGHPVLGRTYRLHLLGHGHDSRSQDFAVARPGTYRLVLESKDLTAPCIEDLPGLPLTVQRCPAPYGETDHAAAGWRQRLAGRAPAGPGAARQLSLGLVLGEAPLDPALADRLLETGSLDRLYQVRTADPAAAARALDWLGHELEPLADYVQVLVWRTEGTGDRDLPAAARRLDLGAAPGRSERLLGLLAAGDGALLEEDALVAGLGLDPAAAVGTGEPVRLLRLVTAPEPGLGPGPESEFRLLRSWQGHEGPICESTNCLAFSPDGLRLASGGNDNLVRIWSVPGGEQVHKLEGHTGEVTAVAFSPDGRWLASGSWDKTAKVWSVADGRLVETLKAPSSGVYGVAFSPDGRSLVSGNFSPNFVHVWNTADWSLTQTLEGHQDAVMAVAFNQSGDLLASGDQAGAVKLWSRADGRLLHTLDAGDYVVRLVFTADGTRLLSGSSDDKVRIWDTSGGRLLRTLEMSDGWGSALDLTPDGRLLAWGNNNGTIDLIRLADGERVQTLTGHEDSVRSAVFSPDGRLLATGDDKGVIKLWQR